MTETIDDLIFQEILPRLPAKSLLRFKCVARQWNIIISSVEFSKTHVRHHHLSSLNSMSVLTLEDNMTFFEALNYGELKLVSKKFGKKFSGTYDCLVSSCNGLAFLISASDESEDTDSELPDRLFRYEFNYVVYNPVLGVDHFVEIPHPKEFRLGGDHPNCNYSFGFGSVLSSDDYYIVAINLPRGFEMVVHLYSLRSQQWKTYTRTLMLKEKTMPLMFQDYWYGHTATLIKETLHWGISQGGKHQFILAYDLGTQNQLQLSYPKFRESGDYVSGISLCCLDDCLCAWAKYDRNVVEMWMLKEYEVSKSWYSWTKLFCIQTDYSCRDFFGFTKTGMVLAFTDENELILTDFSCDPPNFSNTVLQDKWNAVDYVPSLVSVLAIISVP